MGYLNDLIGIYTSYYLIPISLFISLMFMFLIYKIKKISLKFLTYRGEDL